MTEEFKEKLRKDLWDNVLSKVEGKYERDYKEHLSIIALTYQSEYIKKLECDSERNTLHIIPNCSIEQLTLTYKVPNLD